MKQLFSLLILTALLSACTNGAVNNDSEKMKVAATIYPLAFFAEQIGGDLLEVTTIVPQGLEPHDYEPAPNDLKALYDADLVVYNGAALEPWIEDMEFELMQENVELFEASSYVELIPLEEESEESFHFIPRANAHETGEEHTEWDPHVWLDPLRSKQIVQALAANLASIDPENAETYINNAKVVMGDLDKIDSSFSTTLQTCTGRDFVTSHAAFAYLADRYGLTMIPITGINPHSEPSIKELGEISNLVEAKGLSVIYTETLIDSSFAETITEETGATLMTLNPLEGLTADEVNAGENYFSILKKNFENLQVGLSCEATPL